MKKSFLFLLPLSVILSACSVTGPAEDQWDADRKTDETIDVGGWFGKGKSNEGATARTGRVYSSSEYNTENLALDEESFNDFEEFKAWRRAQESGSIDAQEYRDWVEYQKYRQYKSGKKASTPK
jgi:hypothetical protein